MPAERQIDLHFPKLGLDLAGPRNRWPRVVVDGRAEYAAHGGVNVRSYESTGRFRGGSRPGLAKLVDARVPDTRWVVQELNSLVTTDSGLSVGLVAYYPCEGSLEDATERAQHLTEIGTAPTYTASGAITQGLSTGKGNLKPLEGLVRGGLTIQGWLFAATAAGRGGGTGFGEGSEVGDALRIAYRSDGANGKVVVRNRTGVDVIDSGFVYPLGGWLHAVMTWNGSTVRLTVNGVSVATAAYTIATDWHRLTFGIDTAGEHIVSGVDEVGIWNRPLTASEILTLYAGGAGRRPYRSTPNGKMQVSQSGRIVTLLAVSEGTVYTLNPGDTAWATPTNNTGETPALSLSGVMDSAANNQKMFFVDGINYCYYDPDTDTVELWAATGGGTLPHDDDNHTARLIETWRGRTILSGVLGDPHNIFASAASDPFNFDYSPVTPTPTQAWALNTGDLGLVGDVVTGLCPWNDDVLVVFCDHSVYKITGDPASGGQIDRVTDKIGCAHGRAWCKAPDGTLYWISNRSGIYAMTPGGTPQRVSTKIDSLLVDLDMGRNIFRMAYDDRRQEIRLFVTWVDNPQATTHFTLELRPQAWWTDTFADDDMNPLCVYEFDGDEPGDRKLLLGCWDGYVRVIDYDATTDDGVPIESEVLLGPLLTSNTDEVKLTTLQGVFAKDSDAVDYDLLLGKTAEEALEATGVASGSFSESRGYNQYVNRAAHAIYLRLRSNGRWAMELIRAGLSSVLSPVRRRRNG
jgi:hypothetical protein